MSRQSWTSPSVIGELRIIAGAIIPLWQKLKSKEDARLRVVRVSTEDGQRIVGVEISRSRVGHVLRALGLKGPSLRPEQLFHELLAGGESIDLASNLKLKRSTLQREPVIEVECHDSDRFQELRRLGLINEVVRYKQRFFVPADADKGIAILIALLERYPVIGEADEAIEDSAQESLSVEIPATEAAVVDLAAWVVSPVLAISPQEGIVEPNSQDAVEIVEESCTASNPIPEPERLSWLELLEKRESIRAQSRRRFPPKIQTPVEEQGRLFVAVE